MFERPHEASVLHATIAVVLLVASSGRVFAQDTGVGVDLQFGNAIDPTAGQLNMGCDPRGMSWLRGAAHRTPTGFLYLCPPDLPVMKTLNDWLYSATVSLGYIAAAEDDNAQWQRYTGWKDAFAIGLIDLNAHRSDGRYVQVRGSRLNSNHQNLKITGGRAGHYQLDLFFREQPNVVSANARSIWNGIGSQRLTLPDALTPAGSTPAEVANALSSVPERRLEVQRDKVGVAATYYFSREWTAYVSGTHEHREGARPFGGPFFFNFPFVDNGGILEIPRPIDDVTTNVNGGARFTGQTWRLELAYGGSFYRSRFPAYDYETPFRVTPVVQGAVSPPLTTGQFASEPDNDYHNLRVNVTRKIPWNGEVSLTGSAGRMRQNEALLPPMNCVGQFGIDLSPTGAPVNPFLFDCANWSTPAALSQRRADLKIDTTMMAARIVLQPSYRVTLRGDLRYDEQDYRGDYIAFNPLTGQYGYIAENGAQGSVVPDEIGFWDPIASPSVKTRIRNLPLDKEELQARIGADWRFSSYDTFGITYEFKRTERSHRERTEVDDNSVRLTWTTRRFDPMTLRANYTFQRRTGDPYSFDPYEFTFSTALPGYVAPPSGTIAHTVDALRKFDVANRDQHKLDVMATFALGDAMTLSATVRAERNEYGARIGREDYDSYGTTVQWEWQPSTATVASLWYGYDESTLELSNVNDVLLTADPALGGSTYPLDARWWTEDKQRNHYFGGTLDQQFRRVRFQLSATYVNARGTTHFRYAGLPALAWPDVSMLPGNAFPAMQHEVLSVSANLWIPINDRFTIRLFDLYERGRLFDWHYRNFESTRVYDHRVYTDGGPEDYSDNLIGVMFEAKL